jgi:cytochrome bd ubiquinol oxidase subunit II
LAMTALFFLAAFLSLVVMFWPYMIPYSVTIASAAAPAASLQFFFYAGIIVLPIIVVYTIVDYWVFRSEIRSGGWPMRRDSCKVRQLLARRPVLQLA